MSKEKKYLIRDYMQSRVVTVYPETSLKEALQKMLDEATNGLVVVDEKKSVVGILSTWDIIQYIVPDYLEEDKHLAAFESDDLFSKRIKALQNDPVSQCMSSKVYTCKPEHSLMEASVLLSEFHIRQLPIVDESEKLVGYISRTNIKKALGDALNS